MVFSVTAPISAMEMEERAGMEEIGKRKSLEKKRVKSPVKITVKSPKKDSGPGLEEVIKRGFYPLFL